MLAGLLTGIVHDRKLMREAHVNIAIRWRSDIFTQRGCYLQRQSCA